MKMLKVVLNGTLIMDTSMYSKLFQKIKVYLEPFLLLVESSLKWIKAFSRVFERSTIYRSD